MPPLPADSIHARACKLKCEKILTRPRVFNRYRKRTSSQIETKFRYDLSRNPMLITYNLIDKSL